MKSVMNFLEKYGLILIFVLILVQTCVSSSNKRMSEKKVLNQLDSVRTEIKNLKEEVQLTILIEGLNSEFRMIEATNRKIMDLERKDKIKNELSVLDEKLKKLQK
jgi:hypothetical protein